jgi:hypothetical protein
MKVCRRKIIFICRNNKKEEVYVWNKRNRNDKKSLEKKRKTKSSRLGISEELLYQKIKQFDL